MRRATLIGFGAVLLWSLLALFTVQSAPVPPFQLAALSFAIGGGLGFIWTARQGLGVLRGVSWQVYAFGAAGLFGYHALYFAALRLAPPAEAGLIAYLWPLLIVLFSSLLPGESLRARHLIGGALGFCGAGLLVMEGAGGFGGTAWGGYALALAAAVTWAGYSVLSRRLAAVPTASVVVFCLAAAVAAALAHLIWEDWVQPRGLTGWAATLGLGLGPLGLAFFLWDVGVKRGDIQMLGVASYAAPLLSTLILVLAGIAAPAWTLLWAAILIVAGAGLAASARSAG